LLVLATDVAVALSVEDEAPVKLFTGDVIEFSRRPDVVTPRVVRVMREVSNDFDVCDDALDV